MVLLSLLAVWMRATPHAGRQANKPAELPFAKEIAAFKEMDRKNPPAKGQILFIGSSSFTKWVDVGAYFPDRKILNRAFGGSRLPDVIRYVDDVVFPYAPKQIVIYCGENDFAFDAKLKPRIVVSRFIGLVHLIRKKLPDEPIVYVSMKPSPSRWNLRDKFISANRAIAAYCASQNGMQFVDVWNAMLDEKGQPKAEIFLDDRLHMNAKGYAIWKPLIEPDLVPN